MPNTALKPCPFCGSTDIRLSVKTSNSGFHFAMYCWDCNCYGARVLSKKKYVYRALAEKDTKMIDEAKRLWNTRYNEENV